MPEQCRRLTKELGLECDSDTMLEEVGERERLRERGNLCVLYSVSKMVQTSHLYLEDDQKGMVYIS